MGYFYFYGILIVIGIIIQSLPVSYDLFLGVRPDLLLIIITMSAINYGRTAGGVLGFLAGLLQDWFSGGLFGVNSISKTITGYLLGFLKDNIYQNHFLVPPLITFFATIINQLLILFFTNFLVKVTMLESLFKSIIIPLAIFNSFMSIFIYPLIYKLKDVLTRRKFW